MVKRGMLMMVAVFLGASVLVSAAEWVGFWAGGNPDLEAQFEGVSQVEQGRWVDLPLCWGFGDGVRAWTAAEQAVAQTVIQRWNESDLLSGARQNLLGQIFNADAPECVDRPVDIELRWEDDSTVFRDIGDANGDGKGANLQGQSVANVPLIMAPQLPVDNCADLLAAQALDRCAVVVFNTAAFDGYFIDPTPENDDEFGVVSTTFCDGTQGFTHPAVPGGPAAGLIDFYTTVGHAFGYALGLQDSVGCDGSIFTYELEDDTGTIMWGGDFLGRRFP